MEFESLFSKKKYFKLFLYFWVLKNNLTIQVVLRGIIILMIKFILLKKTYFMIKIKTTNDNDMNVRAFLDSLRINADVLKPIKKAKPWKKMNPLSSNRPIK